MCVEATLIARWADADDVLLATRHLHLPVLISGPSDSVVIDAARELHAASFTRAAPLITFRASGFFTQPGLFTAQWRALCDAARDGSVLITALEEMPCAAQLLLLQSLTSPLADRGPRVLSGTTADMADRLAAGEFSEELFYRLNTIHLEVGTS